jgi:hypothetical protein
MMDLQRVRQDIRVAAEHFGYLEAVPDGSGGLYAKAALQANSQLYILSITFLDYPTRMPTVNVLKPAISHNKHRYQAGNLCYMHPNFWNPGRHDLKYVLAQVAVWLNKHEVYLRTRSWPGPGLAH